MENNTVFFAFGRVNESVEGGVIKRYICLLYTSPSPRDRG